MKIKIGSYPKSFSTLRAESWYFKKRFNKSYFFVEEEEYTWFDKVVIRILNLINEHVLYHINKFLPNRKISVRIDGFDTWNLDVTLAHIIHPALIKLKESNSGAPNVQNEDVPKELRAASDELERMNTQGQVDEKYFDRWNWALDEMIFAFEFVKNENCYGVETDKEVWNRVQNGLQLFGKYYTGLWT